MLLITATIVASVLFGAVAERRWPDRAGTESRRGLTLILYLVLPPIIFFNLVHLEVGLGAGIGIVAGLGCNVLVGLAAWFVSARLFRFPRPVTGAVICGSILANTSYLGYPMIYTLMGSDALSQGVLFDVVVSYLTLALGAFAVGAAFGTKAGEGARERIVAFFSKNPLLYAAILAFLAPGWAAPQIAIDISRVAVLLPLVVGFFAVGAIITEQVRSGVIDLPPRPHVPVIVATACRLALAPALLFLVTLPISDVPSSYYLLFAMPTGLNSVIVAHAYGLDLRTTAETLVYTTAIVLLGAGGYTLLI